MHDRVDVPKRVGQRGTFQPRANHRQQGGWVAWVARVARVRWGRKRLKMGSDRREAHDCAHLYAALDEMSHNVAPDEAGRPRHGYASRHSITHHPNTPNTPINQ